MATVRVDDSRLQTFVKEEPAKEEEVLRLFQELGSQLVMQTMRLFVPIRSGFLRESITTSMTPQGFTVYPSAKYAKFVDQGTGPHMIFPRQAKVLRFETPGGGVVFAKHVFHPGFPGRFFVQRTAEVVREELRDLLEQIWRQLHG